MKYKLLFGSVVLCLLVGFTSGQLTDTSSEWFLSLQKPAIYPPGYLFGIVWTVLYVMMGVSLYFIIEKTRDYLPYVLFSVQLVLNFFWTIIFFAWKSIPFALIEILLLWGVLLWTIVNFRKYSHKAAYLLVPYLLWVSFATVLTVSIYLIN